MAHKTLFSSFRGRLVARADAVNEAGGAAYARSPAQSLAQLATTGALHGTYYASAEAQLDALVASALEVPVEYLAKAAVHARRRAFMKDAPALLLSVLSWRDPRLFRRAFPRVVDDVKMLRTFVQIMRSGASGRKSLGTAPKAMIRAFLESRDDEALFRGSVGQSPSLADVIKMVHPRPHSARRAALYAYLLGKPADAALLPPLVVAYEAFKRDPTRPVPDVPLQMLSALPLPPAAWARIAERASWQTTRMNLATFARHGVFEDRAATRAVAERLADEGAIRAAKAFPYQLLAAHRQAAHVLPATVATALERAMEIATRNVPELAGKVYVLVDVSGSMGSPVTGQRGSATSSVRCVDVAALMAACVLRKNPGAEVVPFEHDVVGSLRLDARASVVENARRLASVGGGGTNVSAAIAHLNARRARGELVVIVSDNESWMDPRRGVGTAAMHEWQRFAARNPGARLVCVDLQPSATTQVHDRGDVLNVGGFSDAVFEVVSAFSRGALSGDSVVGEIERVPL